MEAQAKASFLAAEKRCLRKLSTTEYEAKLWNHMDHQNAHAAQPDLENLVLSPSSHPKQLQKLVSQGNSRTGIIERTLL
jgi:hypothetical protein